MSDRRLTPANARVAHESLRGLVDAPRYAEGQTRLIGVPVADLMDAPDGRRARQMQMGESVNVLDTHQGWSFVQATRDDYVGYLRDEHVSEGAAPTHMVGARATHVYSEPDFKSPERAFLGHGARLHVLDEAGRFARTPQGFVPAAHLSPLDEVAGDPVDVAALYLGTPYLWGGNSALGIDCSGLVQAACLACGIACPGDSDMQAESLGVALPDGSAPRRGDLMFWKGHVGWLSAPDMLLHANVHHMAVAHEPLARAITRIEVQGDGPVTAHKRLEG
ncbi:MAG: C40 family peptidase [Roseovarius sp.]|nr:NlpC/P60 family protein [Roseovarius sp.]